MKEKTKQQQNIGRDKSGTSKNQKRTKQKKKYPINKNKNQLTGQRLGTRLSLHISRLGSTRHKSLVGCRKWLYPLVRCHRHRHRFFSRRPSYCYRARIYLPLGTVFL
jgi:hypothetical protein